MHDEQVSISAIIAEDAWMFGLCREIAEAAEGRRSTVGNTGDDLDRSHGGSTRAADPRDCRSQQAIAA